MKLNLGCGTHPKEGYVNVDKYPPADVIVDLENGSTRNLKEEAEKVWGPTWISSSAKQWPWEENSVDEVLFHHSLEHMGATVDGFFHIMRELYRVCRPDATVVITVPHPRHDDFLNDPTHVRPITPMILTLFDRQQNEAWAKSGVPNTPLGLQLGVDFRIESCSAHLEDHLKGLPEKALKLAMLTQNNTLKFFTITLRVVK